MPDEEPAKVDVTVTHHKPTNPTAAGNDIAIAQLRGELERLRAEWDSGHRALIERVVEIESWHTWATRLVLALVITAIVGLVIASSVLGITIGGR